MYLILYRNKLIFYNVHFYRCFYGFCVNRNGRENLRKHVESEECKKPTQVTYPPPHKRQIKFTRIETMMPAPLLTLYADFESSLQPVEIKKGDRTTFTQEHHITGYKNLL